MTVPLKQIKLLHVLLDILKFLISSFLGCKGFAETIYKPLYHRNVIGKFVQRKHVLDLLKALCKACACFVLC